MSKSNTKKEETFEEKLEKLTKYQCTICKNMFYIINKDEKIDFSDERFNSMPIFKEIEKCPFCGTKKKNFLTLLTKEQKEKALEEKKKEEEKKRKEMSAEAKIEEKEIFKEIKFLAKDLANELEKGKINPKQFVKIFINLSFSLKLKIGKHLKNDEKEFLDILYDIAQVPLDKYQMGIDCKEIYENLEEDIKENDTYNALNMKYIDNDKYALRDLEIKTEIDNELRLTAQEKENRRLMRIAEKEERIEMNNLENKLKKSLRDGVN